MMEPGEKSRLASLLHCNPRWKTHGSSLRYDLTVFVTKTDELTSDGFQCVPENLQLKQKIITQLDELAPGRTIIASNSSSYGIFEILEGLTLKDNRRVMSAHCCKRSCHNKWNKLLIFDCQIGHRKHQVMLIAVTRSYNLLLSALLI